MALVDLVLLVSEQDRPELEARGLLSGDTIPLLLDQNPKLSADPELRPSDVIVTVIAFDALTGDLLHGGDATFAQKIEAPADGLVFLLGADSVTTPGKSLLLASQADRLAPKRLAVLIVDVHDAAGEFAQECHLISDTCDRAAIRADGSGTADRLVPHDCQRLQDRFKQYAKLVARRKRSPSVAIGCLLVARDSGRLFLGRKRRGVGWRQWATVGGNLNVEGPIEEALTRMLIRRLGPKDYMVGPLLACTVLTRSSARFVDLTFLVTVPDEKVTADPDEFSEHDWFSLDDIDARITPEDMFEPVLNSLAKYRHLAALEEIVDALRPITDPVRAMRPNVDAVSRYTSMYPTSFRSPYYFQSPPPTA